MLDLLESYKVSPKALEQLQNLASEHSNADLNTCYPRVEHTRHSMTSEKGFLVQRRREYYNDFEDCIRDYKNAKIKSLQKQTKIHLSDGDNGESDSDYVDCNDSSELKHQSSLSSKSMPHVLSESFGESFCQQLELKQTTITTTKTKRIEVQPQIQATEKAQLNANYNVSQIANKTPTQLPPNNNNLNQIIDASCASSIKSYEKFHESKQSIRNEPSTSTTINDVHVNQKSTVENTNEVFKSTSPSQIIVKKEEQSKRKSCKKKPNGETKVSTTQR